LLPPVTPVVSPLTLRINELMWMGSDLSTSDEWLELTAVPLLSGSVLTEPLSLNGWTLNTVKDGLETVAVRFGVSHSIQSGGYIIVANYAAAQSRLRSEPHLVTSGLSLPNTKLHLRLRDEAGNLKDEVDDGIGTPFAGLNPSGGTKASMERVDARLSGVLQSNWRSAQTNRGWDSEANILGTPGFANGSVEPVDVTPPLDAQDLRAFLWSGSVLIVWNPSTSPNLYKQEVSVRSNEDFEVSHVLLGAGEKTSLITAASGGTVFHRSIDESGHYSTGVVIQIQPLHKPIIDELLPDPIGSDALEWIDLNNPFDVPLDLRGWVLQSGSKTFTLQGTGSVLQPGTHILLTAAVTGLTLPNTGGEVRLSFLNQIIDRLPYNALPEGISKGRLEDASTSLLCTPQPLLSNRSIPPQVTVYGLTQGLSTFNLEARALSGSLTGAGCFWNYGDGFTYTGCNPPAHAMKLQGFLNVSLTVQDYCGNTVSHAYSVLIESKPKQSSLLEQLSQCKPVITTALRITEFFPAPDPGEDEWIEIHNAGTGSVSLCGWSIDDGEAGSKPYRLGAQQLEAGGYLFISSTDSRIALNNDQDHVRLIGPVAGGGTGVTLMVPYHHAKNAQAYTLREDGEWLWSDYSTPGEPNHFEEVSLDQPPPTVVLDAALPNPKGTDTYNEWIELKNLTARPQWLNGWMIESASGKTLDLSGIVLSKNELKHIEMPDRFTLGNTTNSLKLIDADGRIRSVLAWRKPKDGEVIRRYEGPESLHPTKVTVLDGLKLRSSFVFNDDKKTVQFIADLAGVKQSQKFTHSINKNTLSALIKEKKIELQSDTHGSIFYAYADGVELAPLLLQMGQVYVVADQPFQRRAEYLVYEAEARKHKRGIWSSDVAAALVDEWRSAEVMDALMTTEGLSLEVTPASGIVSSGQVLRVQTTVPADFYLSVGTGAFTIFSGSILITEDTSIQVMAEYQMQTGTGLVIRSSVATREYSILKNKYKPCIRISEIYSSPVNGEKEWIELENICSEEVAILGWRIDDESEGGSKPQVFGTGITISAHKMKTISGSLLKIVLNNGGDGVSLLMPNARVSDSVWYPSIKKGRSYAFSNDRYCQTDQPTPGHVNVCIIKTPTKKAAPSSAKKLTIGLKTAFRFISEIAQNTNTKIDLGFTLYEGLNDRKKLNLYTSFSTVFFLLLLAGTIALFVYHKGRKE